MLFIEIKKQFALEKGFSARFEMREFRFLCSSRPHKIHVQ